MKITFSKAINFAIRDSMRDDNKVICMGLGATDPKGVFGTTIDLEKEFGSKRVFDIPTSENALTGICIGLSIAGYKPLLTHQRLDFALLSLDQIINNAAKAHYMYGGEICCPLVIRMIMGRGWGQGPTHSQNLQMLFAGIPGLRVVMPGTVQDAYSQLRASINSNDPVIFLEHRWLHNSESQVVYDFSDQDLVTQSLVKSGEDITILACSYMLPEAIKARRILKEKLGVTADIINFRSYRAIPDECLIKSINKTRKLIVADTAMRSFTIADQLSNNIRDLLIDGNSIDIRILSMPDIPEPTSHFLTKGLYNDSYTIISKTCELLSKDCRGLINRDTELKPHDVPGEWFKGPF